MKMPVFVSKVDFTVDISNVKQDIVMKLNEHMSCSISS